MQLTISHTTIYTYETPVHYALQRVRLTPTDTTQQKVQSWSLSVQGGVTEAQYLDHNRNMTHLVNVDQGGTEVRLTATGTVMTMDTAGILGHMTGPAPLWLYKRETALTEPGEAIRDIAAPLTGSSDMLAALHDLSARIAEAVEYGTGQTWAQTTAEEALAGGRGVCQDHAQIFIAAARLAGVPARYVSGYLMMDDRTDQDAGHAWAEAHLPSLGWVGFDVSNGQSPDERYVRIASGRDYTDAAPISGLRQGEGDERMIVTLQVQQ